MLTQNKIAKDSNDRKFDEEDLVVKVEECFEVRRFIIVLGNDYSPLNCGLKFTLPYGKAFTTKACMK